MGDNYDSSHWDSDDEKIMNAWNGQSVLSDNEVEECDEDDFPLWDTWKSPIQENSPNTTMPKANNEMSPSPAAPSQNVQLESTVPGHVSSENSQVHAPSTNALGHAYVETDEDDDIQPTPVNFEFQTLQEHRVQMVYLVTYAQADDRFTRPSFAEAVWRCFSSGNASVLQWSCSMEPHVIDGHHFHMAVKLDRLRRWKGVKQEMTDRYGAVLNFRDFVSNYHAAWTYVTKEDQNYIQSVGHPELIRDAPPRTARASTARQQAAAGNI